MWVPVGVVNDHGVRRSQVQSETPGAGGEQHDEALELGSVKPLYSRRAHVGPRVAVKSFVLVARPVAVHAALQKVLQKRAKRKRGRKSRTVG